MPGHTHPVQSPAARALCFVLLAALALVASHPAHAASPATRYPLMFRPWEVGRRPLAIAAAYFDGDGAVDLVTARTNVSDYLPWPDSSLAVRFGGGDGTFERHVELDAGSDLTVVATGDADGDGAPDILAYSRGDTTLVVLFSDGHGQFPRRLVLRTREMWAPILRVTDVDRDGVPDLLMAGNALQWKGTQW